MEVDEVLGGINRTDVKYPFLILEGYGYDFTDDKSDNLLKNRRGAFMVIDHVSDQTDFEAIQTLMPFSQPGKTWKKSAMNF